MAQSDLTQHAALLLRLSLGAMFIAHALLKLMEFTLPGTVQFFSSVGLPGPLAYLVFAAELAGGTLLIRDPLIKYRMLLAHRFVRDQGMVVQAG